MAFTAFLGGERATRQSEPTPQAGPHSGAISRGKSSPAEDCEALEGSAQIPPSSLPPGVKAPILHLYWIVSEVVDARSFVIRILTMLKRNTKLIWREGRQKREGP